MPSRLRRLPSLPLPGGPRLVLAAGPRARALGLAGLRAPPAGVALVLAPCRCVHTLGMRWPLDLVWLAAGGAVVRVDRDVGPRRVRACRRARAVVEVPAGAGDAVAQGLAAC
jgi:uncharacterized membrane protein (UPF0127 family)